MRPSHIAREAKRALVIIENLPLVLLDRKSVPEDVFNGLDHAKVMRYLYMALGAIDHDPGLSHIGSRLNISKRLDDDLIHGAADEIRLRSRPHKLDQINAVLSTTRDALGLMAESYTATLDEMPGFDTLELILSDSERDPLPTRDLIQALEAISILYESFCRLASVDYEQLAVTRIESGTDFSLSLNPDFRFDRRLLTI